MGQALDMPILAQGGAPYIKHAHSGRLVLGPPAVGGAKGLGWPTSPTENGAMRR